MSSSFGWSTSILPLEPKEEPEPPAPKSNNGILFLALAAALAAGGLGYYFKVYKPKHELDDAEDIDEFDFEGPEEPMVNEDMPQPFGEEPETRDISEGLPLLARRTWCTTTRPCTRPTAPVP